MAGSKLAKKVASSLGLRVLFVCSILLILPLIIHGFLTYERDLRIQLSELARTVEILARAEQQQAKQLIALEKDNLQTISLLLARPDRNALLQKIAREQGLSALFYVEGGACVAAAEESLIGRRDLFARETAEAEREGFLVFLGTGVVEKTQQLYLSEKVEGGVLTLSISAERLIRRLVQTERLPEAFTLSLLQKDGTLFISENPSFSLEGVDILSPEAFEGRIAPFGLFREKKEAIGLKIPLEGTPLALLIDIPEKAVAKVVQARVFSNLFSFFALLIVLGGGSVIWLTSRMARPLRSLCEVMEEVGAGDLGARFEADRWGFEINILGQNFNEMIAHMKARELLESELRIGREIQRSLLPREMPSFPGLDLAAGFIPARQVGGDFYDLFVKRIGDKQQLLLSIADASGKGVSACLYSLCMRSMLRSYDIASDDLQAILKGTNNLFCLDTAETGNFVTAWVGLYDPSTKQLHYSSCGHYPALLRTQAGEIRELSTDGIAMGVAPLENVESKMVALSPGDVLLLYTDGVIEAHDAQGLLFGKERLLKAVEQHANASARELVDALLKEVVEYSTGVAQHDDITLLAVRIFTS